VETRIRRAEITDVPSMVDLSEQKRLQYQSYQPLFWTKAEDSRAKQTPFFQNQVSRDHVIALVHETDSHIDGFVIASMVPSPPVYAAGLTCAIDDFCVVGHAWAEIGRALLDAVSQQGQDGGATQSVVVCGHLDQMKREMLAASGYTIASEWWVKPIV
jgi:hypothetical protein